ncbi:hypothetical protein RHGRI_016136 [Rhododendron griersonianum]|uniref:Uncharacterized protein n=1 Tax=Rhododendron griersonianum TaxID=479676 RepID=A0AAV6JSD8_9ERIC|nr:hypothetical protein RHGRI_016136 [Rhododendron griersonianum]
MILQRSSSDLKLKAYGAGVFVSRKKPGRTRRGKMIGHSVLVTGHNCTQGGRRYLEVQNTLGSDWGGAGDGKIKTEYERAAKLKSKENAGIAGFRGLSSWIQGSSSRVGGCDAQGVCGFKEVLVDTDSADAMLKGVVERSSHKGL